MGISAFYSSQKGGRGSIDLNVHHRPGNPCQNDCMHRYRYLFSYVIVLSDYCIVLCNTGMFLLAIKTEPLVSVNYSNHYDTYN